MPFDTYDLYETLTVLRDAIVLLDGQPIVLGVTHQDDQSLGRPATARRWSTAAWCTFTIGRCWLGSFFRTRGAICSTRIFGREFYGARDLLDLQIIARPTQDRPQG